MENTYYTDEGDLVVYCKLCGHTEHILCPNEELACKVMDRAEPIQNLLPDVPADVREMFISGWCGCCYDLQLMYFPKKALDELTEFYKSIMPPGILVDEFEFEDGRHIIECLTELEWYDGTDGNDDFSSQTKQLREKIEEMADRIDNGEFCDEEEEE